MTPTVRHQSGEPFGRTFSVSLPVYGSVRVLAEPIDTMRQDHITVVDLRLENVITLTGLRSSRFSGFIDLEQHVQLECRAEHVLGIGSSYLRPLNIIPPRIVRFGAKFEW